MKVGVFTSNQPRHLALLERLAHDFDEVVAVQEASTVFPGERPGFWNHSPVMRAYFERVQLAERREFGVVRLLPTNVRQLVVGDGDLNGLGTDQLKELLNADALVVFGASYIRGELCDRLLERGALNLHMGVSPYYRGSSTNFWAMRDRRPEMVGATIHLLTRGLDSGPIFATALPQVGAYEPFALGMAAVRSGQEALARLLRNPSSAREATPQDRTLEIRYSRHEEFTDEVAMDYLANLMTAEEIAGHLSTRNLGIFVRPVVS